MADLLDAGYQASLAVPVNVQPLRAVERRGATA